MRGRRERSACVLVAFLLGRAAHEVGHALLRRAVALEDLVDVLGDRHVDAQAVGQVVEREGGVQALDDLADLLLHLVRRGALGQQFSGQPVAAVARGAGGDQVADAGKAGERGDVGPLDHAQPGHLGHAARDEAGAGVVAEAEAVGHADRHGDGVLDRAAELHATTSSLVYTRKVSLVTAAWRASATDSSAAGDDGGRGHVLTDLLGVVGAGERGGARPRSPPRSSPSAA